MYAEFFSGGLDALPLAARDLSTAFAWARAWPNIRLRLTSLGAHVSGVIEIYPADAAWPRWCLWQTHDGRLQFDDLETGEYALPYPTIPMALRFITSQLLLDR